MAPDFLHHITLTTGHTRQSPHSEVDKRSYFALSGIAKEAQKPQGARLTFLDDHLIFQATVEEDGYVGTVFYMRDQEQVPILLTAGAKNMEFGAKIWKDLHGVVIPGNEVKTTAQQFQPLPFVADRLLVCLPETRHFFLDGISGDFCRCMGWIYLYPEVFTAG